MQNNDSFTDLHILYTLLYKCKHTYKCFIKSTINKNEFVKKCNMLTCWLFELKHNYSDNKTFFLVQILFYFLYIYNCFTCKRTLIHNKKLHCHVLHLLYTHVLQNVGKMRSATQTRQQDSNRERDELKGKTQGTQQLGCE